MGVYIKGMDKPKRCNICPLFRYYHENGNVWCNALNVILESIPYEMRLLDSVLDSIEPHKDCPLVEVKTPHGRLIDAYIVEEQLKEIEEITAMVDIELGDDPEEGEISIPLFTIRNIHKKAQSAIEAEEGE